MACIPDTGTPSRLLDGSRGIARGEGGGHEGSGPVLPLVVPSLAEHGHHIPSNGRRRSKNRLIMCQAGPGPVSSSSSNGR
jgi:hypothetical protein